MRQVCRVGVESLGGDVECPRSDVEKLTVAHLARGADLIAASCDVALALPASEPRRQLMVQQGQALLQKARARLSRAE